MEDLLTMFCCLSILVGVANLGHWIMTRRCGPLVWPTGWTGVLIKPGILASMVNSVTALPHSIHGAIEILTWTCMLVWSAFSIYHRRLTTPGSQRGLAPPHHPQ